MPIAGAPEVVAGAVDVGLSFASLPAWVRNPRASTPIDHGNDSTLEARRILETGDLWLSYPDGTEFLISASGGAVQATWAPELTFEDSIVYLLGPALGRLLQMRGTTCLHASVVAVNGRALAFAGPAGAGKSTIAAAFARAGYEVLSDDLLALDERDDGFWAAPGYSRLRLWGPAVEGLYGSAGALPLIVEGWEKRYLDLVAASAFRPDPLSLGAVYLLADRLTGAVVPKFRELAGSSALVALLSNHYAARLLSDEEGRHLQRLGRLAAQVPIREVAIPGGWDSLEQVPEAIVADYEQACGGRAGQE